MVRVESNEPKGGQQLNDHHHDKTRLVDLNIDVGDTLAGLVGRLIDTLDVFLNATRTRAGLFVTSVRVTENGQFVSLTEGDDIRSIHVDTAQSVTLTIIPKNRRGEGAAVENATFVNTSDDGTGTNNAGTLTFDGVQDPTTFAFTATFVSPSSGSGVAALEFNADAHVGEGENPLHGGIGLSWSPPEATEVDIAAGDATDV